MLILAFWGSGAVGQKQDLSGRIRKCETVQPHRKVVGECPKRANALDDLMCPMLLSFVDAVRA
jgi:hypothetical protein